MDLVIATATALLASLMLTPLARTLAWRADAVCRPDGNRRLHRRPTPTWGGIAVCAAVGLSVAASFVANAWTDPLPPWLVPLAISTALLCLLGCYDDLCKLDARAKLLGQVVAVIPLVTEGFCVHQCVLFGCFIELGWLGPWITAAWLLLGINALNLIDGMDALASTLGIVMSLAVATVAAMHGASNVVPWALGVAGALAGFLVYNRPPARIFLGDCGSMVLGLILAVLSLRAAQTAPHAANLSILVALMFVPLLDTALAVMRRALQGQSLFQGDRGHVHHRLLDRGLHVWAVVGVLGALSALGGAVAYASAYSGHEWWVWPLAGVGMVMLVRGRLVGHVEWGLAKSFLARRVLGAFALRSVPPEPPPVLTVEQVLIHSGKTGTSSALPRSDEELPEVRKAA